ncbi:fluoride efflux transporter CrcB [Haloarcula onubensis]|uniref:Fluoride-specific ion channel FluC n=1 Tax=Haloarcula onubensis TaxID=2950539 RepID=A0ABU2FNQ9_9EURY|nr:fluoride efflux transporter CrcB [Halomicroarcula sp. S3CR25-11]MDS0282049.1 fluoride efflux transporter CrcB [Halomicroarcula sp. S3CR25-11]
MVSVEPAHLVGTGGAIGALLRHYLGSAVDVDGFPLGTLTVNVVGSFVLALVTFASLDSDLLLLVGTGACGSFTTFSSFSFDTVRLWEVGARKKATANAGVNLAGALAAIGAAWGVVALAGL